MVTKVAARSSSGGSAPSDGQHTTLPYHPLTTRGRIPFLVHLPPWGFNTPTPRKWERTKTTSPFPFPWCREGVSASIEACQGHHRSAPSAAPAIGPA